MRSEHFYRTIEFNPIGDSRGDLISLEALNNVPFEIRRVYYIFNVPRSIPRGFHAHKTLRQLFVCMSGSCKVHLDNGLEKVEITLDSPRKGLVIESGVWRQMSDFSSDGVLMVLADQMYDEADYIRNYSEFLDYTRLNKR